MFTGRAEWSRHQLHPSFSSTSHTCSGGLGLELAIGAQTPVRLWLARHTAAADSAVKALHPGPTPGRTLALLVSPFAEAGDQYRRRTTSIPHPFAPATLCLTWTLVSSAHGGDEIQRRDSLAVRWSSAHDERHLLAFREIRATQLSSTTLRLAGRALHHLRRLIDAASADHSGASPSPQNARRLA